MLRHRAAVLIISGLFSPLAAAYGSPPPSAALFSQLIAAKIGPKALKCVEFPEKVDEQGRLGAFQLDAVKESFYRYYLALKTLGWVDIRTGTISVPNPAPLPGANLEKRILITFTPKAKALLAAHHGFLCYDRVEVVRVDNFTVPTAVQGMTSSRANFTYRLVDQPSWTTNQELMAHLSPLFAMFPLSTPLHSTADLTLYNDGWHVESLRPPVP